MTTRTMSEVVAGLSPHHNEAQMLVARGRAEILRPSLGPPLQMHPNAAARLLEGSALWYQRPSRVVPCVAEACDGFDLSLGDCFGVEESRRHDELEMVSLRHDRRRASHAPGHADVRDLRVAMHRALGAL